MSKSRRRHSAEFKFRVALEALKGQKTLNELAGEFSIHPNQISDWKRQLLEGGENVFRDGPARQQKEIEARQAELYEEIGRLKMELDWVKKKAAQFGGGQTRHDRD